MSTPSADQTDEALRRVHLLSEAVNVTDALSTVPGDAMLDAIELALTQVYDPGRRRAPCTRSASAPRT